MDPDPSGFSSLEFVLIVVCLILSGAFSAAETAITSFSEIKAKHLLERYGRGARIMRFWLQSPTQVLTTILVGNNLVNILGSVVATDLVLQVFPQGGVVIATATMTVSILFFSEIVPKVVARTYSERLVMPALRFVRLVSYLLWPAVLMFSKIANFVLWLLGRGDEKAARPTVTEEELTFLIEIGEKEGELEKEQQQLLSNVFQFGNTLVREIMIPRTDIVGVPLTADARSAVQLMLEKGHSRLPVFEEKIDRIVGIVHAKELLRRITEKGSLDVTVKEALREPMFVAESKPVHELLVEMRRRKRQMAIVLDEYGGTAGVVTFEDVIEEIVGEIRDEYDELEEDVLQPLAEAGTFLVDARMNYQDFVAEFGQFLPKGDEKETAEGEESSEAEAPAYDTVGGMVIECLGHIPVPGETIRVGDLHFTVKVADRYRIRKLLLKVTALDHLSEGRDASPAPAH